MTTTLETRRRSRATTMASAWSVPVTVSCEVALSKTGAAKRTRGSSASGGCETGEFRVSGRRLNNCIAPMPPLYYGGDYSARKREVGTGELLQMDAWPYL